MERFTASKVTKLERHFTAGERDALSEEYSGPSTHTLVVVPIHFGLGFFSLFPTNKRGEWEEFRVYNAYQPFNPLNIFPFMYNPLFVLCIIFFSFVHIGEKIYSH